mmetsp:Transcript_27239/g.47671  ORF Transcript_27239/g.47671 Transcript_27239/m.47671 type:complete len:522 (-) Transcript_27239:104-1669(-)
MSGAMSASLPKKMTAEDAAEVENPGAMKRQTSIKWADGHEETLGSRIDLIGFGWYQIQSYVLSCGFVVAEGAGLAMTAGISHAVGAHFHIKTELGRAFLMTCTFSGLAFGTLLAGPSGDFLGRRWTMLIGYSGILVVAAFTFTSQALETVYCLNFMLGTFAGIGIPIAFITISEVTPKDLRGIGTAATGVAFALGELWTACGLRLLNPDLQEGPWRHLVLWAAAPAAVLIILGTISPVTRYDTAHWLGIKGYESDMIEAVNLMARMNGCPLAQLNADHHLQVETNTASKSTVEALGALTKAPLRVYTVVLGLVFFVKDFAFYGSGVFWPLAWSRFKGTESIFPATELILTATLGIPGFGMAMYLMYELPRRQALAGAAILCCIACFALRLLEAGSTIGLIGVVMFKLFFPTWQMVTMLLPSEIFPLQIKGCGYSIVAFCGRLATILAPTVVGHSHGLFLGMTATLAGMIAMLVFSLPETKDCAIVNTLHEEDKDLENKFAKGKPHKLPADGLLAAGYKTFT